ncbi:MAG: DUF2085 domain-containing protein [Thermoplasmata archaeon]
MAELPNTDNIKSANIQRSQMYPYQAYQPRKEKKKFGFFIPHSIVFAFALAWTLLIVIGPYTLEPHTVEDLSGTSPGIENEEQTSKMNPIAKFIYSQGDRDCHQRKDRSFFLNDNQMPYCARCFAIYLGMAIGAGIATFYRVPFKTWWLLGLVPMVVDGTVQLFAHSGPFPTGYESTNLMRVLTGSLFGAVMCFALAKVMYDVHDMLEEVLEERKKKKIVQKEKVQNGKNEKENKEKEIKMRPS